MTHIHTPFLSAPSCLGVLAGLRTTIRDLQPGKMRQDGAGCALLPKIGLLPPKDVAVEAAAAAAARPRWVSALRAP